MAFWCCRWHRWHQKIDKSANIFFVFLPLTPLTLKKIFTSQFFFLYFAVDIIEIWKNMNVWKKNLKINVRWLSDATVDAVDIKKLICQPILFCISTVDTVEIKKNYSNPKFFFSSLSLTLLTSENLYFNPIYFCIFTVDAVDIKKCYTSPFFHTQF